MRIRISGRQIDDFSRLSSGSVTSRGGWPARQSWSRLWNPLSTWGGWRWTCSFGSPGCLRNLHGAIWARKAAGRLVLTKHCRRPLYRSRHHFLARKPNTPHLLLSDLGAWFLHELFHFLHCSAQEAIGHFGYIQRKAHVGLFQLYSTSLLCHSCRHVENLPDIS
jgi:hypothetical protein